MPGQAAPSRVARRPRLQPPVVKWEGARLGRSRGEPAGRSPAGAGSAHWRGHGQSLKRLAPRAGPLRQNGLLRRLDVAGRKRRQRERGKGGGRGAGWESEHGEEGAREPGCWREKEKTMGRRPTRGRAARGPGMRAVAGRLTGPHPCLINTIALFPNKQTTSAASPSRCRSLCPQPLTAARSAPGRCACLHHCLVRRGKAALFCRRRLESRGRGGGGAGGEKPLGIPARSGCTFTHQPANRRSLSEASFPPWPCL